MNAENLKTYIKNVRVIQWFICAIPLGGRLLRKESALAFPHLGPNTGTFVFLAIALSGIAAILPWALSLPKHKAQFLWCSFVLLVCSAVVYFSFSQRYVVPIPIPDVGNISVSVGNVRTTFADQNFLGKTDAEMLMDRGPYENEVKKLWTENSIISVRLRLFVSYLATLMLLNFSIGLIASWGNNLHGNL